MPNILRKKIKKIHIIINPASGRIEPILPVINRVMTEHKVDWDVFITKKPKDGMLFAQQAVKEVVDAVAVYGGDGTVMEVIRGMIGSDVPLAILPGGTANVMSVELGIPRNLEEACRLICEDPQIRLVDVGQLNKTHFMLRLGLGFAAEMMKEADRDIKSRFGRLAYVISSAKAMKKIKEVKYEVKIDGKEYQSRGITCIVANSGSAGFTGLSLDSDIKVDDGLLDVMIVRKATIGLFGHIVATLFRGKRADNFELVQHWQGKDIEVTSTPQQVVECDGEILEKMPIRAKILPAVVKVLVPK